MLYFFGKVKFATGISGNQAGLYHADDIVSGTMAFDNGIIFQGLWSFATPKEEEKDVCEVTGSKGKISFSFFAEPQITITVNGITSNLHFEKLQHVQQPMIEKVVQYFLAEGENPSSAEEGAEVMRLMEVLTNSN